MTQQHPGHWKPGRTQSACSPSVPGPHWRTPNSAARVVRAPHRYACLCTLTTSVNPPTPQESRINEPRRVRDRRHHLNHRRSECSAPPRRQLEVQQYAWTRDADADGWSTATASRGLRLLNLTFGCFIGTTVPPSARGAATRAESASASTRVGNVFAERANSIESCCRMICQPNGAVAGPRLVMHKR